MKSLVLIPASTLAFPMRNYYGQYDPANNYQPSSIGGGYHPNGGFTVPGTKT